MRPLHAVYLLAILVSAMALAQQNSASLINQTARVVSPVSLSQADPKAQAKILDVYGKLPLSFEANHGQTDGRVKFLSRTKGYTLFLTADEAVLALSGKKASTNEGKIVGNDHTLPSSVAESKAGGVLRMELVKANHAAKATGLDELPGKSNYFIGNDPAKWRTNVPTYAKVKYEGIYSGVNLVYYGNQRQLEYDFIVRPGADPHRIQFDVRGAKRIRRDGDGELVFKVGEGEIRWHKPLVYQEKHGVRQEIAARYAITDTGRVGFRLAKYDASRPLYIDPLIYSTYLGGSDDDFGESIAVDSSGNAYVTGFSRSTNFPLLNPLQEVYGGGSTDAFVVKINATGSALVYSTYLGGSDIDFGSSIAVDSAGDAYVTGYTYSTDFPTVNALQSAFGGGNSDAFVAEINPTGSGLVYSTYLGGTGDDLGNGIAVDSSGNAYVTGGAGLGFPVTTNAFQKTFGGGYADAFVAKINPGGSALVYSTYLGGSGQDDGNSIAVDSSGNAYIGGTTGSSDFPTKNPLQSTYGGGEYDGFVAKLNPSGSALIYSTYLGGSTLDVITGIALDSSNNAYVTGQTDSPDFPVTSGAFQTSCNQCPGEVGTTASVSEINATGSALVYSTYLGGSVWDAGKAIAVDTSGNAYVVGQTSSTDFPTTSGALQTSCGGATACGNGFGFLTRVNPTGSGLAYSTYLGGSSPGTCSTCTPYNSASGIALGGSGGAYVTGYTGSESFPTMNPLQSANAGGFDAFVVKIGNSITTIASSSNPSAFGQSVTFTATVTPLGSGTPTGTVTFTYGSTTLCSTVTLMGGVATCAYSALPVGSDGVTAAYSGDANFTPSSGTVSQTVTQQSQTISFPNPGTQTYGAAPFVLVATASSGLPVSYTVASGPATVSSSTLTITGAGAVTVQATQAGNNTWSAATPVSVSFIVNPAVLTVAANNQVVGQGSLGIPALTYSIYGYVNGDTSTSVGLSGTPLLSTAVTSSSSAGTYPIVMTQGTLSLTPPPNYTFAFLNGTLTVSANALNFMDNYFVSGDYVAAGVNLVGAPVTSGMVTGTISIAGVPAGADIVNAFLYWQTVEDSATPPASSGFFNGYAITGSELEADLPLDTTWNETGSTCTATGHTCVMRSYRAEVYPMLPRASNGIYQPNGPQTVQLPAPAQGASLVVIYRVLSGGPGGPPQSQYPLKAVVINDGAWLPANSSQQMIQTVQGFYDGVISSSANVTSIYSTQAGWASNSKTVQLSNGSQYTDTEPSGAWSALVFSVPVNSSDNDGLLDAWKAAGGYCDAGVNQGICNPGVDPSWVPLTGAVHGEQDIFVQMDYMCSGVVSIGSNGVPTCDISGGGELLLPWVVIQPPPTLSPMTQDAFLGMMQQPFLNQNPPIHVHFVVGNAVPEETCTTDNPAANQFCVWPNEPGVVGWKGGLEQIKASPRNPASCNAGGDCTPLFQVGKKDSYHYVLFGHSVSIPSWSIQAGTLYSIQVSSGGWATVTTSAILPDVNGNITCPTRVTIDGALATPLLNGVYNVLPMSGAATACTTTTTSTGSYSTITIQTASANPSAYPVPPGTYPVPNGLPEPLLAIYTGQTDTTSGYSDVGGADSTVTLGKFDPTQAELANVQAGTLMHELGHTLGLTHGGRYYPNGGNLPQYEPNCKPNYQSVMNYLFQFDLLGTPDGNNPYGHLDYSDRALSSLNENSLIPWPGQVLPAYEDTKWFSYSQPPTLSPGSSEVATHCDGTPVGSTESPMWVWDGIPDPWNGIPDPAVNWGVTATGSAGPQDINFDTLYSVLDGYSDWDSIDPRQVGAFATDYVDIAALLGNGGGHGMTGIGGGGHGTTGIGGGGHGTSGIGGGGHGTTGIGGGGHGTSGIGGGGHGTSGIGGGNQFNEVNYQTADSYPRSPRGLTTTAGGTSATISWYGASFGLVQEYIVYSVTNSGTAPIACVYLTSSANCPPNIPNQVEAPAPQATSFSYTDENWSTGETYFVTTVDIGPAGTVRESTPAKQYQTPLTLSAGSPLTYNSSEPLSTGGGTTGGLVTYYVLSGPCSITGNQLTANSGTGSCVVSATMAGNSSYDAVTSPTVTVGLLQASQAALTLTGATSLTYNSPPETLTVGGGSGTGAVSYSLVSGPCSLSNAQPNTIQLTANSGTGSCSVTATKAGDSNYNPVTSASLTVTLNQATQVTLTVTGPSSVTYGSTGTATATGGSGTGALSFSAGSSTGCSVSSTTVSVTNASGTCVLTATKAADNNYNAATSASFSVTLNQASTATALSATPNPANFGQSVSLNATVTPVAPGAGTPTGKVTFQDGSTALATVTMSNAAASFTTSSLAAGTHNLTASYSGDTNFIKSSSAAVAEQVVCGVLLGISPSTMHWGGTVTVTGKVISCSTTAQTVSVKFTLNATLQANKCGTAQSVIFTSPPFTLPAKTSMSVSFPFTIPNGTCTGTYTITATTLVNGTAVNTSTASLTITAH